LAALVQEEEGEEGGKTLMEPHVVPPFHGDQVAYPVMGQFMRDGGGKLFSILYFLG
jgi:hypothetical protein